MALKGRIVRCRGYEAHHVFDIWYPNTSDIVQTTITGDMHSVNKANFAILYWFGPRFTNMEEPLVENNKFVCIQHGKNTGFKKNRALRQRVLQ